MKRVLCLTLIISLLFLAACGNSKTINGKEYDTIGLINMACGESCDAIEPKAKNIKYAVIWENVIFGIILSETIIAPIYFFGFSMFEPIREIYKNESI